MTIHKRIASFIIMIFLIGIGIANIFIPDKVFSEAENRTLKKAPSFSWENFLDGKFSLEFEKYITDQFPFRDFWVGVKARTDMLLQKRDNHGVYLGKEGYLLQKPEKVDTVILNKNIEAINQFVKDNSSLKINFLLAPNSVKIMEDKLPSFATHEDQLEILKEIENKLNKDINFIDIYEELSKHKDEYIYYKTDHHWTTLGAYYGYKSLGKAMDFKPLALEEFNIEKVTDSFYGTLYSKGNYRFVKPDSINIFKPKREVSYKVNYIDTETASNSLYEYKYLDKKDKYSIFLDGNHALVNIKTSVHNGKKLLLLKDSYAHSLIPFIANHYEEIHIIDLRYFNMSIKDYISQYNINEVLLVYNLLSFSEDDSVIKIKFK